MYIYILICKECKECKKNVYIYTHIYIYIHKEDMFGTLTLGNPNIKKKNNKRKGLQRLVLQHEVPLNRCAGVWRSLNNRRLWALKVAWRSRRTEERMWCVCHRVESRGSHCMSTSNCRTMGKPPHLLVNRDLSFQNCHVYHFCSGIPWYTPLSDGGSTIFHRFVAPSNSGSQDLRCLSNSWYSMDSLCLKILSRVNQNRVLECFRHW